MSYSNPGPGDYGPPPQPGQPPAGGYAYPQSAPGYGYPNQGAAYQAAPPVGYPQGPGYGMPMQPSNGMGTTGLVLGIIGVVCSLTFFLWFFGVILGILGIIFGAIGRGKADPEHDGEAADGACRLTVCVLADLLFLLSHTPLLHG